MQMIMNIHKEGGGLPIGEEEAGAPEENIVGTSKDWSLHPCEQSTSRSHAPLLSTSPRLPTPATLLLSHSRQGRKEPRISHCVWWLSMPCRWQSLPGSTLTLVAEPSNYARVCLKMPIKKLGALPASARPKALAFSGLPQENGRGKPRRPPCSTQLHKSP